MNFKLTERELDVMRVLWESKHSLTAKEIADSNEKLSINTVQSILKKLLKKEYIKIAEIVYSGTVLTRSYSSVVTAEDYMVNQITNGFTISADSIMAALLKREEGEEEVIEKLENMIKQYRMKKEEEK